jgi:hypothetical protein
MSFLPVSIPVFVGRTPGVRPRSSVVSIGAYFVRKYQDRAAVAGTQAVALQLKKQGVDVRVAAAILATRGRL